MLRHAVAAVLLATLGCCAHALEFSEPLPDDETPALRHAQIGKCKKTSADIESCHIDLNVCGKLRKLKWRYTSTASVNGKSAQSGKRKSGEGAAKDSIDALFPLLDSDFNRDDCNCGHSDTAITQDCQLRIAVCFEVNTNAGTTSFRSYVWDQGNPAVSGTTAPATYANTTEAVEMSVKAMVMSHPEMVGKCMPKDENRVPTAKEAVQSVMAVYESKEEEEEEELTLSEAFKAAVVSKVRDDDDDDCNPKQGKQCNQNFEKASGNCKQKCGCVKKAFKNWNKCNKKAGCYDQDKCRKVRNGITKHCSNVDRCGDD